MRELVYLSDSKLQQFVPDERRGRIGRRLSALRVTTPVGGLELESAGVPDTERHRQRHLALVVRHIEERALWFQDGTARSGSWVYFEAPLNLLSTPDDDTVLFVDPEPGAVEEYDQSDGSRLLLHGSAGHLCSTNALPVEALRTNDTATSRSAQPRLVIKGSGPAIPAGVLKDPALSSSRAPTAEAPDAPPLPPDHLSAVAGAERLLERPQPRPEWGTHLLLDTLQPYNSPWTASWMRGYARVTARVPLSAREGLHTTCVIATPLYVERASDLPSADLQH
ncbi:SAVMC3_10250 family protein [Streptomyces sp. NPDC051453]|uniref:SAVMC3_10250 family protein n=1 Tax=Streptomyces sp. NPDC051453 TaxID=3154941 RepID=UPI0034120034